MPFTLLHTDNGDGTVTFQTADPPDESTVFVYVVGVPGTMPLFTSGNTNGNGEVTLTVPPGAYSVVAISLLGSGTAAPVYFVTSGDQTGGGQQAVATRLRQCLKSRFSLVNTVIGSRWYEQMVPDETNVKFPCGIISVDGVSETYTPKTNGRDDWGRPALVQICDRADKIEHGKLPAYELARERLMRSVSQQRIPGLPESKITTIEPMPIIDPNLPKFMFVVSGFVVRAVTREPRGLT